MSVGSAPLGSRRTSTGVEITVVPDDVPDEVSEFSTPRAVPSPPTGLSNKGAQPPGAGVRSLLRSVALPSEHGGWGLTAEPVLLGLIVAPSLAGLAIGVAAIASFLARTPLKLVLVDTWRHRDLPRTRLAAKVAAVEITLIGALLITASLLADLRFWIPLLIAGPLFGVELWFDMRSRGRRLAPELAGSVGIGSVGAAVILAGGGSATAAAAAWVVIAARAIASLPFVRYQLKRRKDLPRSWWEQDVAGAAGLGLAVLASVVDVLPWVATAAVAALVATQSVLARTRVSTAVVVGVQQMFFGIAVTVVAGLVIS